MVGWHHRLNGPEFEQTPGDGEGQGNLACCSPWGHRESDTTERLNSNKSVSWETVFPWTEVGSGFRMIQVHYIYYALCFYSYSISSTSDHQTLDLGTWGLLPYPISPFHTTTSYPFSTNLSFVIKVCFLQSITQNCTFRRIPHLA